MASVQAMMRQVNIKSDGDVFYDVIKDPRSMSTMFPAKVQAVNLNNGKWGTVGAVVTSNFTHGGKEMASKVVYDIIDEKKRYVKYKAIDGVFLQLYKSFNIAVQIDTKGDNNVVTWTLEYEKLNENVEDPVTLMNFMIEITKDIETHQLK